MLPMVTEPVKLPAEAGSKLIVNVAVCPGVSVSGTVTPASANPVPAIETLLMASAADPEDVSVTVFVTAVFRATVPKAALLLLSARAGDAVGFSCRVKVFDVSPRVAVRVTVLAALTADAAAAKVTLVASRRT